MKISCLQENLNRGLSTVGHAVASRSALPVLSNILLTTDSSNLKLAATDLQMVITCKVPCEVDETGATTVPAKLLSEFIGGLPNDKIEMTLNTASQTMHFKSGRFEANVKAIDAEDFPMIPVVTDQPAAVVGSHILKKLVTEVSFAAAPDDARPVLAGVLLSLDGGQLTMAAADGFRLAVRKMQLEETATETVAVIVPAKALNVWSRVLGDEDEQVEITVAANRSQILFHSKNVDLVSRLVDGTFPNYNQIIPQSYRTRAVLNTSDLLKATKLASFFARDSANVVKVVIAPGQELAPSTVTISANAAEVGDNTTTLDASVDGEGGQIAFNAKYLTDVLSVITANQVAVEMQTSSSPGVIKPVGDEGYTHVIMPMHLAGGK